MFTLDERQELVAWMRDQLQQIRSSVRLAASLPKGVAHPSDVDVATRLAYVTCAHFGIRDEKDKTTVAQSAKAVADLPSAQTAMIQTETLHLSREDLLDIAHWVGRDDGYPASAIQASAFIRGVIRGNLALLREERVPKKKFVIKRRK
jgi:hypothetical protein